MSEETEEPKRKRAVHARKRNIISVPNFSLDTSKLLGPHKAGKWKSGTIEENTGTDDRESPLLAAQEKSEKNLATLNKAKGFIIMLTKPIIVGIVFLSSFEAILSSVRGLV